MWLPCLFYLYAEYITINARLDEAQARIKITGRNINSLRHAGGTTLMAESQDELKNLLMKESEKSGLKCQHLKKCWNFKNQHSKNEDHGIQSHHFMVNKWGKMKTVTDFILGGSKVTADGDCSHEIKRCLLFGEKAMTNLGSVLKSRDITLPAKVRVIKAIAFPRFMYGCGLPWWLGH